jgi:hypothetical protein
VSVAPQHSNPCGVYLSEQHCLFGRVVQTCVYSYVDDDRMDSLGFYVGPFCHCVSFAKQQSTYYLLVYYFD